MAQVSAGIEDQAIVGRAQSNISQRQDCPEVDRRRGTIGSVNQQSKVSFSSGSTQTIHRHQLKCFYTNANSVVTKIDELRRRTDKREYDIIRITETWGRPDITDAELAIEGYNMFRMDR